MVNGLLPRQGRCLFASRRTDGRVGGWCGGCGMQPGMVSSVAQMRPVPSTAIIQIFGKVASHSR
jgi:hypothetical protein